MEYRTIETKVKPWGWTRCIDQGRHYEAWHAFANAGGFSSRHFHYSKDNTFYVLSGELRIRFYDCDGTQTAVHALTAGMSLVARAGDRHRFEAVADTHFIETYDRPDSGEIVIDDIERLDVGGITEECRCLCPRKR